MKTKRTMLSGRKKREEKYALFFLSIIPKKYQHLINYHKYKCNFQKNHSRNVLTASAADRAARVQIKTKFLIVAMFGIPAA